MRAGEVMELLVVIDLEAGLLMIERMYELLVGLGDDRLRGVVQI